MLRDEDRIFTNLYGFEDFGLEARARAGRLGQHQGPDPEGQGLDHQ